MKSPYRRHCMNNAKQSLSGCPHSLFPQQNSASKSVWDARFQRQLFGENTELDLLNFLTQWAIITWYLSFHNLTFVYLCIEFEFIQRQAQVCTVHRVLVCINSREKKSPPNFTRALPPHRYCSGGRLPENEFFPGAPDRLLARSLQFEV